MMTRVLLVDDHQLFREGLRLLLQKSGEVEVVGEAETGRLAVEQAAALSPEVVIMDIAMPDLNGVDATRRIIEQNPSIKVIALTTHADSHYVLDILDAGASGYLLKINAAEDLLRAIRAVRNGQVFLCPNIAGAVVEGFKGKLTEKDRVELGPREREVLQLLAEGRSSKEIASQLHLSTRTVEGHRLRIMDKLKLRSIAELTKYAVREGLTSLEP